MPNYQVIVFTARRYASAVYATNVSVRLFVCLSQVGVLLRRLKLGSRKQRHTIAQRLQLAASKDIGEILRGPQVEVG